MLVIAEDPLARAGVAALLADHAECDVVGASGEEDLELGLEASHPDALVWDLGWDPAPALERLAHLGELALPIVVLLPDATSAREASDAGASGLLLRTVDGSTLVGALQAVVQGLMVLDPTLAPYLALARDVEREAVAQELSPRELEVLRLVAEGLPNKSVAQRLGISEHTVKFHVNAILGKLDAQSRTEAVMRAMRLGLIPL